MMLSRTDIERRYLAPGTRLTEPQWAFVRTFVSLDDQLEQVGIAFGKTTIRALLLRYLADRDHDADDLARGVDAERRRADPPPRIPGVDPADAADVAAAIDRIDNFRPDVRCARCGLTILEGDSVTWRADRRIEHKTCPPPAPTPGPMSEPAFSEAARKVWRDATLLDAKAGRSTETMPERVARAVRDALAAEETVPDTDTDR